MTLAKPLGATAFAAALAVGAAVLSGLAPGRTADPPAPPPLRRGVACTGYVEADGGLIHLTPARPGRVESVAVREGDAVAAGATLLRLDDRDARSAVDQADAAMRAAEARLAQADEAVRLRPAQLDALRATAEAADGRAAAARHALTQRRELQLNKLASAAEVASTAEQANAEAAAARAARARLTEATSADPSLGVRAAKADLDAGRARADAARHALADFELRAPTAGTVTHLAARRGESLAAPGGAAAVVLAPEGPLMVRAEIEQEFIAGVRAGSPAWAEDEAAPAGHWTGRATRVANWYTPRKSAPASGPPPRDLPVVEVWIALDPGHPPLRIGQRLNMFIGGE